MDERLSNSLGTLRQFLILMILRLVIVLIAIVLVGVIILVGQPASRGFAQSAMILIQPPSSNINVGNTVTVDIRIEDVTDLYGVDVRLSFDHTLLEVQDADGNPANGVQIQEGTFPAPDLVAKNEVDNGAGTIWYVVTQLNPTEPVSGSGVAASVTFKGLADGTSSVAFTYQEMLNRDAEQIPATTQDGPICVLFGDLDGDGDVDIVDIMLVVCRWQTSCENPDPDNDPDTPNYDALYDVNDDCIIDLVDIMQVATRWRNTCP